MKKLLTVLLALVMILGLSVTAFADAEGANPMVQVTFTNSNGGVTPAETFTFSDFTAVDIREGGSNAAFPTTAPSIADAEFAEGAGTSTVNAAITLPTYPDVGIYTYKFSQIAGTTAGVTYATGDYYLVVTIAKDTTGNTVIAAVHCESVTLGEDGVPVGEYGKDPKSDKIENKYESGALDVTKTVTGNLGDVEKKFSFKVTFTPAAGTTINSKISYTVAGVAADAPVSNNEATFELASGETASFTNIPAGVTYKVVELDGQTEMANNGVTSDGYTVTFTGDTGTITAGSEATAAFTNDKDMTPDTGVVLDSLPYVVIAVLAISAIAVMIVRKRRVED